MKKRYGIGLFIGLVMIVGLVAGAYRLSYRHAEMEFERKAAALENTKSQDAEYAGASQEEHVLETDGDAKKEDTYYLAERNGYVVVYLSDRKTVYEYTSIETAALPEAMEKEIQIGKEISGTKNLYGFLENYSS